LAVRLKRAVGGSGVHPPGPNNPKGNADTDEGIHSTRLTIATFGFLLSECVIFRECFAILI